MATNGFYGSWGFLDNPFSPMPLVGDAIGARLLIGREEELKSVIFRLKSGGEAICLNGPVGVGKTSLANVAAFRAEQDYVIDPKTSPLILPCRKPFQISPNEAAEELRFRILTEVTQTLIEKAASFKARAALYSGKALDSWLNSPLLAQFELQIAGIGAGQSSQLNDS